MKWIRLNIFISLLTIDDVVGLLGTTKHLIEHFFIRPSVDSFMQVAGQSDHVTHERAQKLLAVVHVEKEARVRVDFHQVRIQVVLTEKEIACKDLEAAISRLKFLFRHEEDQAEDLVDSANHALFPVCLGGQPLGNQALLQFVDADCGALLEFLPVRMLSLN